MNGDGKPDLIGDYCDDSNCTSEAGVLLGNGDGTFQPGQTYATGGTYPASIAVADVNGDGKLDLLVVNECASGSPGCIEGSIGVLLGNGDGTFQPVQTYSSGGTYAGPIAVADVNGDGKPDLLVGNYYDGSGNVSDGKILVLLGKGDGTFQPAQSYDSGGVGALSIVLADVNGDGKPDLLVANDCASLVVCTNGSVTVLLGNGNGTFQPAVSYNSGGVGTYSVAVGDINGDGKPDLVVANQYDWAYANSSLGVLFGKGDGTFQAAVSTLTPLSTGAIIVDDFDGDGKLDVATSGGLLLLGIGDGTFQSPLVLGVGGAIAVGDINRDGKPDLVLGDVAILLNIASGFHYTTTTVVTSSLNPALVGQSVTFTAAVTPAFNAGALTGCVTFYDGTTALGTVAIGNGQATFNISSLSAGTHSITASYSGDTNYLPSTSAALTETVNTKVTTTTTLVSSMNPSVSGKPVTFTANVSSSAGTPTGKVQFLNGTTVLATLTLKCGSAKYTTAKLPPGSNVITAVYGADSNISGSTSAPLIQVVLAATTTTLTSSPNPSAYGQVVIFTARVTSSIGPPPDGETVTFKQGTTVLGTGTLSGGTASFTTSTLPAVTNAVKAVYGGDSNFAGSTSKAVKQVVTKATTTTTLASSQNPSKLGQSVTFTATVAPQFSGTVKGTVTFYDGTTVLKTVSLSGGVAKCTTAKLTSGAHSIKATYNGNTNFIGSSASLTQTVN